MPIMNGFRATEYILKYAKSQIQKNSNQKQSESESQIEQKSEMKIPTIIAITGDSEK